MEGYTMSDQKNPGSEWKSTKGVTIKPNVMYAVIKHATIGDIYPKWELVCSFADTQELWNPEQEDMGCTIEYYDLYMEIPYYSAIDRGEVDAV